MFFFDPGGPITLVGCSTVSPVIVNPPVILIDNSAPLPQSSAATFHSCRRRKLPLCLDTFDDDEGESYWDAGYENLLTTAGWRSSIACGRAGYQPNSSAHAQWVISDLSWPMTAVSVQFIGGRRGKILLLPDIACQLQQMRVYCRLRQEILSVTCT